MTSSPETTRRYYRRQQRLTVAVLLALRQVWQRMEAKGSWSEQYEADGIGAQMVTLLTAAQVAVTRDADTYVAEVLNELAFGPQTAAGVLLPRGFVGLTGDGRTVAGLLAQAVATAGVAFTRDYTTQRAAAQAVVDDSRRSAATLRARVPRRTPDDEDNDRLRSMQAESLLTRARSDLADLDRRQDTAAQEALTEAQRFIDTVAATILADTARAASSAAMVQRPWVGGYVRMLNPPSCSRCVVLAGKFYKWNTGFARHPLCDCRHIPASEAIASDLTLNPDAYFQSLTTAEQDKTFTSAGAQAVRDGADLSQVVNARRGMQTAQVGGRDVLVSLEGTTRRGAASRARTGRNQAARLMPESIYANATDRADAIRLLKLNGFIS